MNPRVRMLRARLQSRNLQGMIVTNPVNIKYLLNLTAEGVFLITRKENIFITNALYLEEVKSTLTIDDEIIVTDVMEISKDEYENFFLFCENVGFEETHMTYATYKEYMHKYRINNFEETEYIIEKQRMIKDEEEINYIKKACEITDECFSYLLKFIKKGMTEKEIAKEIEKFFNDNGADGLAFDPIVASGVNSSKPHAIPTDRKIQSGDIIVIDMGCKYKGYCSDMTRTIFVDLVQDYVKKVYDLVLKNQLQTLREIRDGANTKMLFKMVENDFKLHNFDFVHSLGHNLGLNIHEGPMLSSKCDTLLKENMVLTDEPGIYIPGKFGVRIEDTVHIEKIAGTALTKSKKDYIII